MNSRIVPKIAHQKDRCTSSWTVPEVIGIRLWFFVWLFLMSWTPKCFNRWRLFLLRLFGAKIINGGGFVYPSARVYVPWNLTLDACCLGPRCMIYNLGEVVVEKDVTVSMETLICGGTHDFSSPRMPLLVGKIELKRNAFLGARAIILPGVCVGENAVVGAGSVVSRDVPPDSIVAGNPARRIKTRKIDLE